MTGPGGFWRAALILQVLFIVHLTNGAPVGRGISNAEPAKKGVILDFSAQPSNGVRKERKPDDQGAKQVKPQKGGPGSNLKNSTVKPPSDPSKKSKTKKVELKSKKTVAPKVNKTKATTPTTTSTTTTTTTTTTTPSKKTSPKATVPIGKRTGKPVKDPATKSSEDQIEEILIGTSTDAAEDAVTDGQVELTEEPKIKKQKKQAQFKVPANWTVESEVTGADSITVEASPPAVTTEFVNKETTPIVIPPVITAPPPPSPTTTTSTTRTTTTTTKRTTTKRKTIPTKPRTTPKKTTKRPAPTIVQQQQQQQSKWWIYILVLLILILLAMLLVVLYLYTKKTHPKAKDRRKKRHLNDVEAYPADGLSGQCQVVNTELRPYHLPPDKIQFKGPLKIHNVWVGPIKHATDDQKSHSIKKVVWDDENHEAFEIGSQIEQIVTVGPEFQEEPTQGASARSDMKFDDANAVLELSGGDKSEKKGRSMRRKKAYSGQKDGHGKSKKRHDKDGNNQEERDKDKEKKKKKAKEEEKTSKSSRKRKEKPKKEKEKSSTMTI